MDTWGFAGTLGCPHTDIVGVLISLEAEEMLKSKLLQTTYFVVSAEGQRVRVATYTCMQVPCVSCPQHLYQVWAISCSCLTLWWVLVVCLVEKAML